MNVPCICRRDMHQIHAHYALEGTSNYQGMNLKVDYDIYTSVACVPLAQV